MKAETGTSTAGSALNQWTNGDRNPPDPGRAGYVTSRAKQTAAEVARGSVSP